MINLEWLRTFRAVYKTQSASRASELLSMSQPGVSQHIAALESHIGKKLFIRKSKGVEPTDHARLLNNQVASAFDDIEAVEQSFRKISKEVNPITTIGISEHLYHTVLADHIHELGSYVHVSFGKTDQIVKEVETGNLTYGIIPGVVDTFDADCHPLFQQELVIVHTHDLDMQHFKSLMETDKKKAERWLSIQHWYSHRSITPFIKQYWMKAFDKKRPTIMPRVIIPNEYEVLRQLSQGSGMALTFDTTAASFVEAGQLQSLELNPTVKRTVSLVSNRRKTSAEQAEAMVERLL